MNLVRIYDRSIRGRSGKGNGGTLLETVCSTHKRSDYSNTVGEDGIIYYTWHSEYFTLIVELIE